MDELMEFTMLKGKLYLKLERNDASYTKDLALILPILPNMQRYNQELRGMLIGLSRQQGEWAEMSVFDVADQTGCVSKEWLTINRKLTTLDRKSSDIQASIIRDILESELPKDSTTEDISSFYSECANAAISSRNNELLEELILKMEALNNG